MTPYQAAVLADSPMGYWPLDDIGGSTARDLSGNSRTGTLGTGVTEGGTPGPGGTGSMIFNGSATADISLPAAAFQVAPFTWEAKVNLTATANASSNIFSPSASANSTLALKTSTGAFQYNNGGSPVGGGSGLFGGWHLVGASIDGSGNLTVYVDGLVVMTLAGAAAIPLATPRTGSVSATTAPVGTICDFASYPTALSGARMLAHYNAIYAQGRGFFDAFASS